MPDAPQFEFVNAVISLIAAIIEHWGTLFAGVFGAILTMFGVALKKREARNPL